MFFSTRILLSYYYYNLFIFSKYIIRAKPGAGNYSRVPVDDSRVQFRNGAESPTG